MELREIGPADAAAARALLLSAFPGPDEANLVEAIRASGDDAIGLAACEGGRILGVALFSPMRAPEGALGLGPVATAAEARRRGVAAALIREGIARARGAGWRMVFVLGEPAYYRRFGFAPAGPGWTSPFPAPWLQMLALDGAGPAPGPVRYAAAFDALG